MVLLGFVYLENLETYINEITYKDYNKAKEFLKTEAWLLLVVIQTVSEAIRFKYIQDKITKNSTGGYAPDFRAVDLEINWDKISKAIEKVDSQTGKIPKRELTTLD